MNLTQITVFQAVMTSDSLSEAARKLGRTQPAVSAAIRALEDQLGMKLFRREGRRLVPVPEARYLLSETQSILGQLAQVRQTMQSLVDGSTGNLTVAAMPGPVSMLFPQFIARQVAGNPDVKITITARTSAQIAELARAQSIDFGFADALDARDGASLYSSDVIAARCFAALPESHTLAGAASVSLSDLSGEPLGTLHANHPHRLDIEERFAQGGHLFHRCVESQTFLAVLQFVAAGQCCAILDPLTVAHVDQVADTFAGVVIRPLQDDLWYRYALVTPRHRPISLLAEKLRLAWREEVLDLLHTRAAMPQLQLAQSSSDSVSS
ncbi:MAG: LysR substrate-binding domain-containing protein [Pseudomonadota bacterium]